MNEGARDRSIGDGGTERVFRKRDCNNNALRDGEGDQRRGGILGMLALLLHGLATV